jgi:error-prone DNA polymerase
MMNSDVAHLHVHSHFSFLDGASSPEALVRRAAELGQGALALTDWAGLYGAVAFDAACRAAGVRPLFGAEIALAGSDGTPGPHLTLLVRNRDGWRSLCRLLSAAQLAGAKGHAPVAPALLASNTAGLLCLSGCRHGALAALLLADDADGAWTAATWLRGLFDDDLWIEIPRNDRVDDRPLGRRLAALAARLGVGVVATANVHYASPEEGPLADTLACIRAGVTLEAARHLHLPEAVANTAVVANRCTFALDHDRHTFPAVPLPPERTPDTHLRALCRAGLTDRYADGDPARWRRAVAQLDHELGVIGRLGLAGYFLVVWDVVRYARSIGVPCQGRGSAAGSVVAYTLGISRVDPLAHRLLFERFLSEERASLPDIDIDFGHRGRERVIQYIYATYGADHVGMACTIQTYHTRGAVRDVGKALGLPPAMLEQVATRVRRGLDADLAAAVIAVAGEAALDAPIWGHLVALVDQLIGTPRHLGIHNGVVVTGPPLGDLVPLERATMPGRVVVQWDKDSLEAAGLTKLDVLSLQSLDLVDEAVRLVRRHEGIALDLDRLPLDDAATYDLLCAGDTIGCFQVESRAQQQALPQHAPRTFGDLVAQISIIRPGPLQGGMVHPYLRRRRGEEPVRYAHPLLEEPLRDTLGVILYQEQVLEVATALAGFSPGEGDTLRRAMGSKRSDARMRELTDRFATGAAGRGVPPEVAAAVFGQIAAFAGYGFPRSHAVAFARLAYETCYLKAHHPAAFYCARLNAQPGGFYHPSVVIGDAQRHGLMILGPDLAVSGYDCTLEPIPVPHRSSQQHAIRLGLRYVRGLAAASGAALVAERDVHGPFRDLADLCRRGHHALTPHTVAALIAAGACDGWRVARRQLQWALPATWAGATGLPLPPGPVALPPETADERRVGEGWATGVALGDHPLAAHRADLTARGILPLAALADAPTGATVTVAGQLVILQRPPTAQGVAFVTLEDETGLGNLVLSPEIDRRDRAALHAGPLVVATGRVQRRAGVVNVQVARLAQN